MIKKISNIATLNKETYKKNELPSFLNYLDTGNLTKDKVDEYKRLILGKDKIPSRAQRKVRTNTILYSTVRPNQEHFGFVENPIENLIVSTGFTTIDVNDENIDSKFLYFKLTQKHITSYLHTIGMNSVSSYPSISPNDIGSLKFDFPPLSTQKQIAKVLSDLDAKIEINNKINQQLEAMAKTLYDYWFVQFDFPSPSSSSGQAGKPYKSSGGKMVFNEELKREIPEGWEVKSLTDISKIKAGGDKPKIISKVETQDCKIPIYSNGVTNDGLYGYTNLAKIEMPSITVSARGTIGFSVLRKNPFVPIIRLISITPKSFFMIKFLHERVKLLEFENSGSVQKQLTVPQVSRLKIVVPSDDLLKKYHSITNPQIEIIDKNKKQNQKLSELRDWLLPMLMNGQVSVGNTSLRGTKQSYSETSQNTLGFVAEKREDYT